MEIVTKFLDYVLKLLPTSPFISFIDKMDALPYLGWFNYFVPVSSLIVVGEAWLVSVALFYLYSILLRWIKAIE